MPIFFRVPSRRRSAGSIGLMEIREAVRQVHFPGCDQEMELYQEMRSDAHRRLIYDEFFFFQLGMALRKRGEVLEQGIAFRTRRRDAKKIL